MQSGARLQASVDVLTEILDRGRPASVVLADWARSHRFAGSGDRASIGNLVFDGLRRRASLGYLMGADTPRALALGVLRHVWGLASSEIAALCSGQGFDLSALTAEEEKALDNDDLSAAGAWVQGDYPEWLDASFQTQFGARAIDEGRALAQRAPVDLRVNTLKATRAKVCKALARYSAVETPFSPVGVRLPAREGGLRGPNIEADAAHGRGWFEVQDEGSQIASLLAGAEPRLQVVDLCAGSGGKTLAMAAQMQNSGQIYAYDADAVRFRPIFERLKRAGARNVQTLTPGGETSLHALRGRMDVALLDAPCTGSGVWRRRPDAKWRLTAEQLENRKATQRELLATAASLLRVGGTLAYVTCSLLPEENEEQARRFLSENRGFAPINVLERSRKFLSTPISSAACGDGKIGLLLTPAQHQTDGFYIALFERREI